MKKIRAVIITAAVVSAVSLASCAEPAGGGSPYALYPEIPRKFLTADTEQTTPVETVLFVDTARQNPLNAGAYFFGQEGRSNYVQFFNYVVLSRAYLSKERGYTTIKLTPELKYILDNGTKYLKPLKLKGIRVLVEIRSGDFNDSTEDGIQAGFGTMDMAAINEFTGELKLLVDKYALDGFDFNDIGGGKNSYSPQTLRLTQFQSDAPLYSPKEVFGENNDKRQNPASLTAYLRLEGGCYFSALIQRSNEELKESYTMTFKNGDETTTETQSVERFIFVQNVNHGNNLPLQLRAAYMPDAYTGADPKLMGNLRYVLYDGAWGAAGYEHATLINEENSTDEGGKYDNQYGPMTIDLENRISNSEAEIWAQGWTGAFAAEKKYGVLVFKNMPPSQGSDVSAFISKFTRELFGRPVNSSASAAGYTKDW